MYNVVLILLESAGAFGYAQETVTFNRGSAIPTGSFYVCHSRVPSLAIKKVLKSVQKARDISDNAVAITILIFVSK